MTLLSIVTAGAVATDFRRSRMPYPLASNRSIARTSYLGPVTNLKGELEVVQIAQYGWPTRYLTITFPYATFSNHYLPYAGLHMFNRDKRDDTFDWHKRGRDSMRISRGIYVSAMPFLFSWLLLSCVMLVFVNATRLVFRKRRKSHQCKACGYDITGLRPCPECDHATHTTVSA